MFFFIKKITCEFFNNNEILEKKFEIESKEQAIGVSCAFITD